MQSLAEVVERLVLDVDCRRPENASGLPFLARASLEPEEWRWFAGLHALQRVMQFA